MKQVRTSSCSQDQFAPTLDKFGNVENPWIHSLYTRNDSTITLLLSLTSDNRPLGNVILLARRVRYKSQAERPAFPSSYSGRKDLRWSKYLDWSPATNLAQLWEPMHTKFPQTILANEGGTLLRDRIIVHFMNYREFIFRVAGSVWPREQLPLPMELIENTAAAASSLHTSRSGHFVFLYLHKDIPQQNFVKNENF